MLRNEIQRLNKEQVEKIERLNQNKDPEIAKVEAAQEAYRQTVLNDAILRGSTVNVTEPDESADTKPQSGTSKQQTTQ